jgi:hypothetical protein
MPALFSARGAQVLIDDSVAIASFDITTTGQELVLAGGFGPLFALFSNIRMAAREAAEAASRDELLPVLGRARAAGSLSIAGRDVGRGEHVGFVGAAPLDPPLPAEGSAHDYVAMATRFALIAWFGEQAVPSARDAQVTRSAWSSSATPSPAAVARASRAARARARSRARFGSRGDRADRPLVVFEGDGRLRRARCAPRSPLVALS